MIKTKIIKQTIKSRLFTMNKSNTAFVFTLSHFCHSFLY